MTDISKQRPGLAPHRETKKLWPTLYTRVSPRCVDVEDMDLHLGQVASIAPKNVADRGLDALVDPRRARGFDHLADGVLDPGDDAG
jgi:hypothetical protein